jgi:hypothetical protein
MQGETLPLITEFVVDRVERSFGSTFVVPDLESPEDASSDAPAWSAAPAAEEREVPLPSIDEFVLRHREEQEYAAVEEPPVPEAIESSVEAVAPVEEPTVAAVVAEHDDQTDASSSEDESFQDEEVAQPSADVSWKHPPEQQLEAPVTDADDEPAVASDGWVADERDAFDWKSVASLTVPADEERRAAEEWSTTEWERGAGESTSDHLAMILAQVARRVRSGELAVQGTTRQMSTEAALAAVLAALLAEPDADR